MDTGTATDQEALRRELSRALSDPTCLATPGRVTVYADGTLLMSPPPSLAHDRRARRIAALIEQLAPHGQAMCPAAVEVFDVVRQMPTAKHADAAWSPRFDAMIASGQQAAHPAPEICVEVLSPSNTGREISDKKTEYFRTGASEV